MAQLGSFSITSEGNWSPEWESQHGYESVFVFPDFGTIEIALPNPSEHTSPGTVIRAVELRDTRWPMRWATLHTVWHDRDLDVGSFRHNTALWYDNRVLFNFFLMMTAEITRALPAMTDCYRSQTFGPASVFAHLCYHDRTALSCVSSEFNRAFRADTEIGPRIKRVRAFIKRVRRADRPKFKTTDIADKDIKEFFLSALGARFFDVVELAEWFAIHAGRTTVYDFVARKGARAQPKQTRQRQRSEHTSKRRKPS